MNSSGFCRVARLLIIAAVPIVISEAAGPEKSDFSGSYTMTGIKGGSKSKKPGSSALQVIQTDTSIEVTRIIDGKASMNRFKLDGTETPFRSDGGAQGIGTARFKGKTLVIDTQVATRPQTNGPAVQIHAKEQWSLSADLKTLTIRTDVEFPNSGLGGFQLIEPWSEIYTRSQTPVPVPLQTQTQGESGLLRVNLQDKTWVLQMAAPGFVVTQNGTQPDGRRYVLATSEASNLALSITLERVAGKATLDGCRDVFRGRTAPGTPFKLADISESQIGDMAVLEYLIPVANNVPVKQKNLFGCLAKDDVYADIHLSKAGFKDDDEPALRAILTSAKFSDAAQSPDDVALLFKEGSAHFVRNEYDKAIGPYQNALDKEKKASTLPVALWRVLVDNLAMAYGITGKLETSEQVLNYGVSKDPTYPMFYFLLADTCAERNDLENTLKFLRLALKFRENINPGEKLPDPLTDDSFKRFYQNEQFKKLAGEFR
jgi:tetratricopeptide (TPR) repeat protein